MNDYMIWVTYHKDEQVAAYGLKNDETHRLFASHHQIEGKNINHLNPVYSEMATMWYVWQNAVKSDFVGFNHYRRRFDVYRLPKKGECQVYRVLDFAGQTVYEQYAQWHNAKDMDIILNLLEKEYGADNKYAKHIRNSHKIIPNCCFLMKWSDFTKMCRFLFPLLERFSEACGITDGSVASWRAKAQHDFGSKRTEYQTRVVSFLAERLISAWITTNMKYYIGGRDVAIVHCNTPELTEAAILSLNKFTPGCKVWLFDNSDEKPFKAKIQNVEVIDNTKRAVVDFEKELERYPEKWERDIKKSNYGSAKHSMSIDALMNILPDGFVLMDSDVLVKKNIGDLWKRDYACAGSTESKHNVPLLMPFLCWLNVPMLREKGIRYFNGEKMWALSNKEPNCYYDTGAWLLEEVRRTGLTEKIVDIWQYVVHLGHGSWRRDTERASKWLNENAHLWK